MTIHELLSKVPAEAIVWQRIDQSCRGAQLIDKGRTTELRICTDRLRPEDLVNGTGPVGMLIWIPQEYWKRIIEEVQSKRSRADRRR
jgi:hypothetical protein